jgi:hypothetical protein
MLFLGFLATAPIVVFVDDSFRKNECGHSVADQWAEKMASGEVQTPNSPRNFLCTATATAEENNFLTTKLCCCSCMAPF